MPTNQPTREQFKAFEYMYKYFNRVLFSGALPPVFLNFSRRANSYGFFAPERWQRSDASELTHEISINPAHLALRPPRETASTLVHEMCHLWQHVHGAPPRRGYHDRGWSAKMKEVGLITIDPATGEDRQSAPNLTHRIEDGGPFAAAFAAMPAEYLFPWQCAEASGKGKGKGKGAEGEGEEGKEAKSRNKVKYSCPSCSTNVWGRPELQILCGPCGEPFAAA